MKNPNGYGTVTKLSGNRRKPWIVKEGKTGRQKIIGYAPTKQEGMILLAAYNQNPWDIETSRVTLKELYELWLEKRSVKLAARTVNSLRSAYKHIQCLENMRYCEIKAYHMQDTIDSCGYGYSTQAQIKSLWNHLDKFAMELDIITKRYSDLLTSASVPQSTKKVFTDEEVERLWENQDVPWVDSVLFLLYTGFRLSEFMDMKTESVDLASGTMTGGVKTDAGKNRIVPIHSKIFNIIQLRVENSKSGYLFEYEGRHMNQTLYRVNIWVPLMNSMQMNHTPHECRHTLRSRLDSAGANKVCIDRIMGHVSKGTGERVYTHKTIEELKECIELVTN